MVKSGHLCGVESLKSAHGETVSRSVYVAKHERGLQGSDIEYPVLYPEAAQRDKQVNSTLASICKKVCPTSGSW